MKIIDYFRLFYEENGKSDLRLRVLVQHASIRLPFPVSLESSV